MSRQLKSAGIYLSKSIGRGDLSPNATVFMTGHPDMTGEYVDSGRGVTNFYVHKLALLDSGWIECDIFGVKSKNDKELYPPSVIAWAVPK